MNRYFRTPQLHKRRKYTQWQYANTSENNTGEKERKAHNSAKSSYPLPMAKDPFPMNIRTSSYGEHTHIC
ncbi:hypothetical protein AC781_00725 [Akkermansia glycaniphila]|nr:hypothetical protein AC781_00725 [Akkermansia glycaniphila]